MDNNTATFKMLVVSITHIANQPTNMEWDDSTITHGLRKRLHSSKSEISDYINLNELTKVEKLMLGFKLCDNNKYRLPLIVYKMLPNGYELISEEGVTYKRDGDVDTDGTGCVSYYIN